MKNVSRSEPPASAGGQFVEIEIGPSFAERFEIVESISPPVILRRSSAIEGTVPPTFWPPADAGGSDKIEVISGGNFHGEPLALAFDYYRFFHDF